MSRTLNGTGLFKQIDSISAFRIPTSTFGDTVSTDALTVGDADVTVSAVTNFTAADYCAVIGSGGSQMHKVGAIAGSVITFAWKNALAHIAGARVVELVEVPLGHISEQGLTFGASLPLTPVKAATSRTPIAYMSEPGEMNVSFSLLEAALENLLFAAGATETLLGTGTAADPHVAALGQDTLGSQGFQVIRMKGTRFDAKTVWMDFVDAKTEVNLSATIGSGQPTGFPATMKPTAIIGYLFA